MHRLGLIFFMFVLTVCRYLTTKARVCLLVPIGREYFKRAKRRSLGLWDSSNINMTLAHCNQQLIISHYRIRIRLNKRSWILCGDPCFYTYLALPFLFCPFNFFDSSFHHSDQQVDKHSRYHQFKCNKQELKISSFSLSKSSSFGTSRVPFLTKPDDKCLEFCRREWTLPDSLWTFS